MPKLKRSKSVSASEIIWPYAFERIDLKPPLSPSEWCEKNIHFGYCKSPPVDRFDMDLTPYLRELIDNYARSGLEQVSVCFIPQSGKSLSWQAGMLWGMANDPGPGLIVYPNDDIAEDISTDRVVPLLRSIPQFEQELKAPFAVRKDCYQLSESITHFTGSGSAASLASRSVRRPVADEVDKWLPIPNEAEPLDLLRHRMSTYVGKSLLVVVCTPTTKNGVIWVEYLKGSMAEWYWLCIECGHRFRPNTNYFKFDRNDVGDVISDSPSMVCPECGKVHKEADRYELNLGARWQHTHKSRMATHRSYHLTALASPFVPWKRIAEKIVEASANTADPKKQQDVDNAILGIPFSPRRNVEKGLLNTLNMHKTDYTMIDIEGRMRGMFMAVDTQDNGFFWTIRAVMDNKDTFLIECGFAQDFEQLEEEWSTERLGRMPMLGIIDQGGHRTKEVTKWVRGMKYWYRYRGESRYAQKWVMSRSDALLINALSRSYQSDLLFHIYTVIARDIEGFWYIPADVSGEYLKHIVAISPNLGKKNGEEYEEWISHSKNDHFFDCEKMWLVIHDMAIKQLKPNEWYQPLTEDADGNKKVIEKVKRKAKVPMYDEYDS